ncbi:MULTISPECIES: rod shape-determining protein RodA [Syntrophotalea]|jgi:rod shape determining protein RodA|uniref:Peptidoglycan glycosyltransferase RodA n=1 Tax=Syntrophotalea acetylenica TaxID=29542 RepID=A0A1L3GD13_SYNAC|nr:rod shape-determining protein RodA [Syntrophotalea acetylenica]APG23833.1 rod shape-determining protein RodA [Syntrophotalea acetylenica]MDY0261595.1 rod shape-determining protein RodA [Syntrophotalea acetylenica]
MFDRRLLTHFNWGLLLLVLIIAGLGILNLVSVTSSWASPAAPFSLKQLSWLAGGMMIVTGICAIDYRRLEHLGGILYAGNLGLLLLVLLIGRTSMGATRWLDLKVINLQPSELMKIVIIIVMACFFSRNEHPRGFSFRELWVPFALLALPALLIMKQPDLGTAMIVLMIGGSMALFAGIRPTTLTGLALFAGSAASGGWFLLHGYQKQRILTFLNPESDPLGAGYHIIQSKIAVGSGGFWGKGFREGTQSQLSFLPERHTDFAFSVFAEEWGFAGALLLLALFLLLVIWGLNVSRHASTRFGMFLAFGVSAMLFFHIVINLGMVIGLLPVVGVPLPLFSYGGTSMITTMTGVGLLLNVSMRRFKF